MKRNVGITDRVIRISTAAILIVLFATEMVIGQWGITIAVIAGLMFLTAAVGVCPFYTVFGVNTCKRP